MAIKETKKLFLLFCIHFINLSSYAMDNHHPLETKRIVELACRAYHHDLAPDDTRMAISRTVSQYLSNISQGQAQLIIGAGKKGPFSLAPYAPFPLLASYTVDILPQMEPDAVLDAHNPEHLAYFPTASFNSVIVDFFQLLTDENIHEFFRILAPGGTLIVQAGGNQGWPALDIMKKVSPGNTYWVSEDGRSGVIPITGGDGDIDAFKKQALINANGYFKERGFSSVKLKGTRVFILTRSARAI